MNNKNKKNSTIDNEQLFLVTKKSLPNILLDVLKVKNLIEKEHLSIKNATEKIGISRTSYYKYCDEVFYYNESPRSKEILIEVITIDKVGVLSIITNTISKNNFNILTINQFPPVDKNSHIHISIVPTNLKCNLTVLIEDINKLKLVKEVKIKSINEGRNI